MNLEEEECEKSLENMLLQEKQNDSNFLRGQHVYPPSSLRELLVSLESQ